MRRPAGENAEKIAASAAFQEQPWQEPKRVELAIGALAANELLARATIGTALITNSIDGHLTALPQLLD